MLFKEKALKEMIPMNRKILEIIGEFMHYDHLTQFHRHNIINEIDDLLINYLNFMRLEVQLKAGKI